MKVTLVGCGCGTGATLTQEGRNAIESAQLLIGAKRLLENLPEAKGRKVAPAILASEVMQIIKTSNEEDITVVYSGDTGFYSGSKQLVPMLREAGITYKVLPGISSIQLLAAKIGVPWQDWNLCSGHGRDVDPVAEIMKGKPVFFLTGGDWTPANICRSLNMAGLGNLWTVIGEKLGSEGETLHQATALEHTEIEVDPLSVMLVEPAPAPLEKFCSPGIPDEKFLRGKVPMTKRDVRSSILSRLQLAKTDVVWDVGAGTGSVSIEMAKTACEGRVYAVEQNLEGCGLIEANRRRFGAYNLDIIMGMAPEALTELPAPDAVFIGGSKGTMEPIIKIALEKNPKVRICATGIIMETAMDAVRVMSEAGMETHITQITTADGKKVSTGHMMMANNPIYIVWGESHA